MDTIEADGRRRRRRHSAEFKAQAVGACRRAGVSIAAVAMSRGVNANLLRRWVVEAERQGAIEPAGEVARATQPDRSAAAFVPLALPPADTPAADIRIELRRGAMTVNVVWPAAAATACAAWLRELLR